MPTGYAEPVYNGKPITFRQFVMRCARAMDPCIMMWDDPMDKPIPDQFEPITYHVKQIDRIRDALSDVRTMSDEEAEKAAQDEYQACVENRFADRGEADAANNRLNAMLEKVRNWLPPTEEHVPLKDFMVQQLLDSRAVVTTAHFNPEPAPTGREWREQKLARLEEELRYHKKENKQELERTKWRNNWIKVLRESLPSE